MAAKNEFGSALFLLCREDDSVDSMLGDVKAADAILTQNPDYVKLLDTPALSKTEKLGLVDEAFGSLSEHLVSLLKMLCERRLVHSFRFVFDSFYRDYDEYAGIERVEAVTAVKMSEKQLEALEKKLHALTGKTIIIKNTVSPEILGGVKLRYSGVQLDGSLRMRLDAFEDKLKNIVI